MANKVKKFLINEFKGANFKSFFFFLVLSTIIWLFVQFSKHYTEILKVPVTYINYPKDKIITQKGTQLEIQVRQTGFQIAWFKLFQPNVELSLTSMTTDSSYLRFNVTKHQKELLSKMPIDLNDAEFLDRNIYIPFSAKSTKKVPVRSRIQISYAPGFSSEKTIHFSPDSVIISGPREILDSISKIQTIPLTKEKVNTDLSGNIKLANPYSHLSIYRQKVHYQLKVDKFTERYISVPIEIINAPKNLNINLYPPNVQVSFMVSLKRYNQIKGIDFKVVCDFSRIRGNQSFLIPKITEKPAVIQNVKLWPRKVQYLIKK